MQFEWRAYREAYDISKAKTVLANSANYVTEYAICCLLYLGLILKHSLRHRTAGRFALNIYHIKIPEIEAEDYRALAPPPKKNKNSKARPCDLNWMSQGKCNFIYIILIWIWKKFLKCTIHYIQPQNQSSLSPPPPTNSGLRIASLLTAIKFTRQLWG